MPNETSLPSLEQDDDGFDFTEVKRDDLVGVNGLPVSGPNCLEWGPHNVLAVCTSMCVYLYLFSIHTPTCAIYPARNRHLCVVKKEKLDDSGRYSYTDPFIARRSEIVGAKWCFNDREEGNKNNIFACGLSSDRLYPATSRLCVQTTYALIVYRVSRSGYDTVKVSQGIVISLFRSTNGVADQPSNRPTELDAINGKSKGKGVSDSSGNRLLKVTETKGSVAEAKCKAMNNSDAEEEEGETEEEEEEEEEGEAGKGGSSQKKRTRGNENKARKRRSKSTSVRGNATSRERKEDSQPVRVILYDWLEDDILVVISSSGIHLFDFCGDFSDDDVTSDPPASDAKGAEEVSLNLVDSPLFSFADSEWIKETIVCANLVRGSLIRHPKNDTKSEVILAAGLSTLYAFASITGHRVGSKVEFLGTISLYPYSPSTTISIWSAVSKCERIRLFPTNEPQKGNRIEFEAHIVAYISVPMRTIMGGFKLEVNADFQYQASEAKLMHEGKPRIRSTERLSDGTVDVDSPFIWHPIVFWLPKDLQNEISIRHFTAVSLRGHGVNRCTNENTFTSSYLLFGVGLKNVFAFHPGSKALLKLFSCPNMGHLTAPVPDSVQAVRTIVVHPSCQLCLMAVETGIHSLPPLHLLPISASVPSTLLFRALELCGVFSDSSAAKPSRPRQRKLRGIAKLSSLQKCSNIFIWEYLFPDSTSAIRSLSDYTTERNLYSTHFEDLDFSTEDAPSSIPRNKTSSREFESDSSILLSRYIALREEYGVELYLRFMCPNRPMTHTVSLSTEDMEWWAILLSLRRRWPRESFALKELNLANAILLASAYMNFSRASHTISQRLAMEGFEFVTSRNECATRSTQINIYGAFMFLKKYLNEPQFWVSPDPEASAKVKKTPVSNLPSDDSLSFGNGKKFQSSLKDFFQMFSSSLGIDFLPAKSMTSPSTLTATDPNSVTTRGEYTQSTNQQCLFPCSICDVKDSVELEISLSSQHTHNTSSDPPETHTTIFSGKTFSPLSIFSSEEVLTRCSDCGLYDFATGPLCRVCGGILL